MDAAEDAISVDFAGTIFSDQGRISPGMRRS
jgi:hypothetical protein